MSVKPVSLAAALGKAGEVRDPGKRPPFSNRFEMLRDRSRTPSISGRSLSPAVKRRLDENSGQTMPSLLQWRLLRPKSVKVSKVLPY